MYEILRIGFFVFVLLVIGYIDLRRGIIPNKIVYPAIIITGILNMFSEQISMINSLIGGVCLAVFFIIVSLLLKNIGMGDIKLGFLMGLMTGFPEGIIALFSGIFLGGMAAIILVVSRIRNRKSTMPYGPFLTAGAVFTVIGMQLSMFDFLYCI
ncbi:MAG: prepilin peptidase [Dehalococcoidales bacterium]|nr:prepilin peptidase [Dehalococcoidales bacterium]